MSKKNNNKAQEIITKRWKLLQANALDNNKAVESAKKLMEISNKLVPKMPKTLLINEQINSMINQHIPTVQAPTNQIATIIEKSAIQQLNVCSESITQTLSTSVSNIISQIAEVQMQFMNSIVEVINKSISPALKTLYNVLEEALNNPDSRINWMNYYDKLSNFYWIMPYKVTTEELHEILQYIETEKEFDKYINKYFTKTKLNLLFDDISNLLSNNNQRKIFTQIIKAYENKSYALASIGITTMIDNLLSYYLIDKGCSTRVGLFEPIIKDLYSKNDNTSLSFIVMMVNSNINLLYETIEFNNKISINTNKKARRNPIAHGKFYSYKKIDTIMLFNTLYYLLIIQKALKKYKNSVYKKKKKKEFYIPSKEEKREIKEKL